MANCLGQPRSARQMVCSNRPKVGVGCHSHGHFPEQLKTFLPTNVGTADAMGRRFVRKKRRFGVNSRAGRSQLLRWTLDQKKPWPVTGKRMRRRQDMRSAPVGPAGGMRNVHTDRGVSWAVQLVGVLHSSHLLLSPIHPSSLAQDSSVPSLLLPHRCRRSSPSQSSSSSPSRDASTPEVASHSG